MEKYSLLVLAWITYLGLHSVFAADGVKQYFKQHIQSGYRYYRLLYVFFSTIGLFAMLLLNASISSVYFIESGGWNRYFSLMLGTFAIFIFKAAFKQYSLKGFAGFESDEQEKFKADGILKHVRHPIYLGTILMVMAFWLFIPNVTTLISACCIFMYLAVGIPLEEKKLIKRYGEAYLNYKQSVPALIPRFRKSS